jgi:hypothetical protein
MASAMALMIAGSRPSLKLGTHSIRRLLIGGKSTVRLHLDGSIDRLASREWRVRPV